MKDLDFLLKDGKLRIMKIAHNLQELKNIYQAIGEDIKNHLLQQAEFYKWKNVEYSMGQLYFTAHHKNHKNREYSVILNDLKYVPVEIKSNPVEIEKLFQTKIAKVITDLTDVNVNPDDVEFLKMRIEDLEFDKTVSLAMASIYNQLSNKRDIDKQVLDLCICFELNEV